MPVESFFKTMSIHLMPRLTGRTFGNIIERGDYDSKGRAALTVDDLCAVLTRWVVDIYHRMPHEGLDGETPAACWDRLTDEYGVAPAADLRRRRMAFGTRLKRVVGEGGVTILGVRYHSEALARKMLRRRNHEINIRWYSEELGAIAVEVDGEWLEVPAVFRRFDGVRAQSYLAARRALQAPFKHEAALQESVIFPEMLAAADRNVLWKILGGYCETAGLALPERGDLPERLVHAGRGRFGRCIEQIIDAIEVAMMRGDDRLDMQHFADAFFSQEGCSISENVFLVPRWSSIDLSARAA